VSLRAGGIAGIVLVVAALGWYLGSPLFIRTTISEVAPSAARVPIASASGAATTPAAPVTLSRGELGYVDAIHNEAGAVLPGDITVLRFENVAITDAPDVHVYLSRETGGTEPSVYKGA